MSRKRSNMLFCILYAFLICLTSACFFLPEIVGVVPFGFYSRQSLYALITTVALVVVGAGLVRSLDRVAEECDELVALRRQSLRDVKDLQAKLNQALNRQFSAAALVLNRTP